MHYIREFNRHIRSLIDPEKPILYRSNINYLKTYFDYIVSISNDNEKLIISFLQHFDSIDSITVNNIEKKFAEFILFNSTEKDYYTINIKEFPNGRGIYFLFDETGEVMYIGKSKNLTSRVIESNLMKLPLGVDYYQHLNLDNWNEGAEDVFESIAIDYYLPTLNNKFESFNVTHKIYYKVLRHIEENLYKSEMVSIDISYNNSIIEE
jgi:hypothetical protein